MPGGVGPGAAMGAGGVAGLLLVSAGPGGAFAGRGRQAGARGSSSICSPRGAAGTWTQPALKSLLSGKKPSSKSSVEEPCGVFYPPLPQETLVTSHNFYFASPEVSGIPS